MDSTPNSSSCWSNIVKTQPPQSAATQTKTVPAAEILAQSCNFTEGIAVAVVDANAIIQGAHNLTNFADKFVTVPEVLAEIRDPVSRNRLNFTPFSIDSMEPSPDCLNKVIKFARATGDLQTLSDVDLKLIALTCTLETQMHGTKHLRDAPPPLHTVNVKRLPEKDLPGWGSNVANLEEWEALDNDNADKLNTNSRILPLRDLNLNVIAGDYHSENGSVESQGGGNSENQEDGEHGKILVKINEVVDDAVEKQTKEESVKRWLGKLRNLACDVDYLLDEFQTEAFQRMLLQDDDDVMSKVKVVDARMQDIASQIDPLDLRKKSAGKSRNVGRVILSAVRLGGGGRDPPGLAFSRIKIFSKSELLKATKNFHHCLGMGGFGSVYKGVLPDNTQVVVKKYICADEMQITEWEFLGIISQVKHKNVVKILGLCLETKVTLLVYEFVSNGALSHYIHDKSSQVLKNWKTCLRIAAETASAIHYLHSLASPSIIHSDVKSANILLDDNYTAKVSDFESLVPISSDDETAMSTMIRGTVGYLDPEYAHTGILTKKSDVYSFGVVLVELLTGMNPNSYVALASNEKISMVPYFLDSIENNSFRQILNFQVADESEMEEIEVVAELASKCLRIRGTERPTMKEVSEELDRLRRLQENYWARKNNEESEHLLGESSTYATAVIAQPETQTVVSIDIENYYEPERKSHCSTEKKMPEFTLGNSFHYGSQKQTISDLDSETIEMLLTKMTSDRLWQFAHEEKIQDDLIGWKKMLVKINEVLDDAMEKQTKEESVNMWLGQLQNLACDVDYLFDELQTEAFQRKLLLGDDAMDKFDSMAMSKVKDVNASFQDIASQIDLLGLKESSVGKS